MSKDVHILELAAYEAPVITENKKDDYVSFGEDNNYYQFLIDCYTNSTTQNAIVNNTCRLVYGKGLNASDASQKPSDYAAMVSMFNKEDVRNMVNDLKLLGQCAMQVIYSKDRKKIAQVHHMPVQLLRAQKCNADGKVEGYYYSDNWTDIKNYPPKLIPAFGTSKEAIEIYFVKPYSVGLKYYALPDYVGALPYCTLEESISEYLINEVNNGFSSRSVVNFNNGAPSEEQQRLIKNKIMQSLTGTQGEKVIVSFNSNAESKTTVDAMPVNDAPDLYSTLSEECLRKIMLGHNVTSPLLFGIASTNGFSSNADELKNSYILFENMVIKPMRMLLIDAIDQILAFNGIALKIHFEELQPLTADGDLTKTDEAEDIINGINSLSPLVANKVLENMSPEEIRSIIGLKGDYTKPSVNLSEDSKVLQDFFDKGEDIEQEGYVCIDEREVNYDLEDGFDAELKKIAEKFKPKQTTLSKIVNLLRTGRAAPNKDSEQDREIDGTFFKVRYQYTGNPSPQRKFCRLMMRKQKVYRKEDILALDNQQANPGFGPFGSDTYSIWLHKGGAQCKHKWKRRTYMSVGKKASIGSAKTKEITESVARGMGYIVEDSSWNEASIEPIKTETRGYYKGNPATRKYWEN